MSAPNTPSVPHPEADAAGRLRTMKWFVFWAFLVGAGLGFAAGYAAGIDVARKAADMGFDGIEDSQTR